MFHFVKFYNISCFCRLFTQVYKNKSRQNKNILKVNGNVGYSLPRESK